LDKADREILINAMENYIASYNDKNLSTTNAKRKAFFGKTKVYMTWGLFGGGAHEAEPTLRAEYQLLSGNKPYFISCIISDRLNILYNGDNYGSNNSYYN